MSKAAIAEDFIATVEAAGVQVLSVVDGLLSTDPDADAFKAADAEMLRSLKAAIVRAEKRKLVARMNLGRMRAKAQGRHVDGPHQYGSDPRRPDEARVLQRMRDLQREGLTYYGIARKLEAEGERTRSGGEKWQVIRCATSWNVAPGPEASRAVDSTLRRQPCKQRPRRSTHPRDVGKK